MALYACKICGKMFERVGNGVYCSGPHYRPCPVCGQPVAFHRPTDPYKCCSRACTNKLSAETRKSRPRKCAECGKLFVPKNGFQQYCEGPHVSVCTICGKEFEYACSPNEKPATCGKVCQEALRSRTAQERYGVKNVSQIPEIGRKISQAVTTEESLARRRAHNVEKWGVDNPAKHPDVRAKMSEIMQTEEYLKGREATCIGRYGAPSPMMTKEVLEKRTQTNLSRYGMKGHPRSREELQKIMVDGSKVDEYIAFKQDPQAYIESHYLTPPTIAHLEHDLGVTNTPIYNILIAYGCSDMLNHSDSSMEIEVINFLEDTCPGIHIIRNDRTIIKPMEIDIYLPDYKIGIECNPAWTHNSSQSDPWGAPPKPYTYHQKKSIRAKEAGVFLFHMFGYDWTCKREIVQSMLKNLLYINKTSIGARTTHVEEITHQECLQFLDANHQKGAISARVRLGLKTAADELVAVMTFNKLRPSMGKIATSTGREWELSRFCTRLELNISGGASKLFQHFLRTHHPETVISFSDFAHTKGDLYRTLGFQEVSLSAPSYVWSELYDRGYFSRVSCQKRHLKQLLHDDSIDIVHMSERQIMEAHKYVRIFDSGVVRWEYHATA